VIRSEVSVQAPVEEVAAAVAVVAGGATPDVTTPAGARWSFEPASDGATRIVVESPEPSGPAAGAVTAARRARHALLLWRVERHVGAVAPVPAGGAAPPPRTPPAAVTDAVAALFGGAAALRTARGLHPRGVVLAGRARIAPDGHALAGASAVDAVVRLSRGIGLPHPWPDFNGVAVRLLDAHGAGRHQDVLLTAAGSPPVLRHVLVPVPSFRALGTRSVLRYRAGGRSVVLGADPLDVGTLAEARAGVAGGRPLRVRLRVAPLLGRWRLAAEVELTDVVEGPDSEALGFDPWRTGPDLVPIGALNRLRLPAYAASRAGRPRP
jgi:hypothetical protein